MSHGVKNGKNEKKNIVSVAKVQTPKMTFRKNAVNASKMPDFKQKNTKLRRIKPANHNKLLEKENMFFRETPCTYPYHMHIQYP